MREIETLTVPRRGLFLSGKTTLYARPINMGFAARSRMGIGQSQAARLADSNATFQSIEVILRDDKSIVAFNSTVDDAREWALEDGCLDKLDKIVLGLTSRRKAINGIGFSSPLLMGVVNVTPDSFYDGGRHLDIDAAISHPHSLIAAGADIIDVGGESSRPGSSSISDSEELDRVLPVIENVVGFGKPVSIDTKKSSVMMAAVAAGASIINDISSLSQDRKSLEVAVRLGVPIILMHMQGQPVDMQNKPYYDCAPLDVYDYLEERVQSCLKAGISSSNLLVDPGVGFGKSKHHNRFILNRLSLFHGLGVPIALGASRKSIIAELSSGEQAEDRLPGSLAIALWALSQGVQILRVHDVTETRQAIKIYQAVVDEA